MYSMVSPIPQCKNGRLLRQVQQAQVALHLIGDLRGWQLEPPPAAHAMSWYSSQNEHAGQRKQQARRAAPASGVHSRFALRLGSPPCVARRRQHLHQAQALEQTQHTSAQDPC